MSALNTSFEQLFPLGGKVTVKTLTSGNGSAEENGLLKYVGEFGVVLEVGKPPFPRLIPGTRIIQVENDKVATASPA